MVVLYLDFRVKSNFMFVMLYRMKQIVTNQTVKIPEGLTVTVRSRLVTVKGPRGILKRSFKHLALDIRVSKYISLLSTIACEFEYCLMIFGFPFICL